MNKSFKIFGGFVAIAGPNPFALVYLKSWYSVIFFYSPFYTPDSLMKYYLLLVSEYLFIKLSIILLADNDEIYSSSNIS